MTQAENSDETVQAARQAAMQRSTARHPAGGGRRRKPPKIELGWREYLVLSELGVEQPIKAKVDTGAATSSLHAQRLVVFPRDGMEWARFVVYPQQRSTAGSVLVEAPVAGWRSVRSSNGKSERRPVINTEVHIAGQSWTIEVTLSTRDQMGFRMLLGRKALRGRALVDVSRSYLGRKLEEQAAQENQTAQEEDPA